MTLRTYAHELDGAGVAATLAAALEGLDDDR